MRDACGRSYYLQQIKYSPNSNQICLTGVSQYGAIFDGFLLQLKKCIQKLFFLNISPNGMSHTKEDIK